MTTTEHIRQKQARRMLELCKISRQRYLNAGGNPRLSVGSLHSNDNFTAEEKQEFLELARASFDSEYINNYLRSQNHYSGPILHKPQSTEDSPSK